MPSPAEREKADLHLYQKMEAFLSVLSDETYNPRMVLLSGKISPGLACILHYKIKLPPRSASPFPNMLQTERGFLMIRLSMKLIRFVK